MNTEIVSQLIEGRLSGNTARRVKMIAERLLNRIPPNTAAQLPAEEGLEIALMAEQFLATRTAPLKLQTRPATIAGQRLTLLEVNLPDCAFIVDTIREFLHQNNLLALALLHPIFSIARDPSGAIVSFEQGTGRELRESLVMVLIEGELDEAAQLKLAQALPLRLAEMQAATGDFTAMTGRALQICDQMAPVRELVEVRDFLRWLVSGGWIFLGYQSYRAAAGDGRMGLRAVRELALGIVRAPVRELGSLDHYDPELLFNGPLVIVGKSRAPSWVHRTDLMDEIIIRRTEPDGIITLEHFLGLFTSKATAEEAEHVPLLRDKLHQIVEAEGLHPGTHDYKELVAAFNGLPKEELFRASVVELRAELGLIVGAMGDEQVRLTLMPDRQRGMVVAMVLLPRDRFSSQVRMEIQAALAKELGGPPVYYHLEMREGYSARLHFCFAAPPPSEVLLPLLEETVARLTRTWNDRLLEQLIAHHGEVRGSALAQRYAHAFSAAYQTTTEVDRCLADIEHLEALLGGQGESVEVCAPPPDAPSETSELRIYQVGERPALSDLMPMLQNFGLRVLSEDVHELDLQVQGQDERAFVLAFLVQGPERAPANLTARAAPLAQALAAVRTGGLENDALNTLVLMGGLTGREVALLRAYLAAAFQMKLGPAPQALRRVFLTYPPLARYLIDLFGARLDPNAAAPQEAERLKAFYIEGTGAIDNLSDDRTARRLLSMVEATVRTNYFVVPPRDSIALKFESARISDLPDVAPLYEIHVDSPSMQGCHLRAGKVARGGIRASDRIEDFRTEILDLMKTQTVKNAIIVPVGAKGGFVLKQEGPASAEQSVAAYKTLIDAMLDLTDNVVDGEVVHPPQVRILDGDDPYLVVAADKGTAEFSDIANELAQARNYWLGDAFASGGTHGYDHKKLGITARGAWESAKRHLREMGRDPERGAPITAVGIGDMSGDVFGNGMLQSANLKLLAAFNHRHIFLDPDPDPARSYAERRRLFDRPHSQWSDYDPAVLSAGGAIVRRGQKLIALSAQVRAALDIAEPELDSDSLIKAILRARVDLLYNGGIGTYVRASDESDPQVGDHTNDACRVSADQLRAKIVIEGGNLGFTQRARIEYALSGGRINTDAIDNSAGVDLSDHEVNLKVLMAPALHRRAIDLPERNQALAAAAPQVVELVLRNNRDQALLLSLEQARSTTQASLFREHMSDLQQRGLMHSGDEALPSHEALRERHARFAGLTRPELALLVAYTKQELAHRLGRAAFIQERYLIDRFLRPYFPPSIVERFDAEIPQHQLRAELVATTLVNEMVDLMGALFIFALVRDFDVTEETAVMAWLVASAALEIGAHVERLKAHLGDLIPGAEIAALFGLERAANRATRAVLAGFDADAPLGDQVARLAPAFAALAAGFEEHLAGGERARLERAYRELRGAGLPETDAYLLARLTFADHLIDLVRLSATAQVPELRAAQAFFALAGVIDFAMLDDALGGVGTQDRWERRAAQDLALELQWARLRLTRGLLRLPESSGPAAIGAWLKQVDARRMEQVQHVLAQLRTLSAPGLAPMGVAVREISRLAAAAEP